MKTSILCAALILVSLCSIAQKTEEDYSPPHYKSGPCKSSFLKVNLEGEIKTSTVEKFLKGNLSNLKDPRVRVKLNYINESPGGFHYSFTQTFLGIDVFQSEIKVNLDRKNTIRSLFDNSENTAEWSLNAAAATERSVIAIHPVTQLPVIAARRIENNSTEILELDGEIIYSRSINAYFAPDSLVTGRVFVPDPLTSSGQLYGAPYADDTNKTNPSLDAELQTVSFTANFNGAVFTLESNYVHVRDFDLPTVAPSTSALPVFNFDRSQSGFEEVNAFYHISAMQQHIHSLGFDCADGLVEIDVHALSGSDQSYFSPGFFPNRIFFGDGGIDDAEDADVCVHEYGHFVSESAAPGSNFGQQRTSLDEGFGDYLAGSYSKSLSGVNDFWVFNWDGHNEFWKGRILNTAKIYPDSLSTSIYRNGEMWAAALFALHNDIGREATDSLILETHYSYAQNISMADAAQLLIDADTLLNNGHYYCPIYKNMRDYGFVGPTPNGPCAVAVEKVEELNLLFAQDGVSFTLRNFSGRKTQIKILNISGQVIDEVDFNQQGLNYSNSALASGVYLVAVKTHETEQVFKWCKVKQ
jgi:hypothetical protein